MTEVAQTDSYVSSRAELDSHADTSCFGSDSTILHMHDESVDVTPFLSTLGSVNVRIVTAAVAYDDPNTSLTYILEFPQVLYIEDLDHHLINPNQLRYNGLTVNDTPLMFCSPDDRHTEAHAIVVPTPPLVIPLFLNGVISYFSTRKPDDSELYDPHIPRIQMTSDRRWQPYEAFFQRDEHVYRSRLTYDPPPTDRTLSTVATVLASVSIAFDSDRFVAALSSTELVTYTASATSLRRKGTVTPELLASRWHIGLATARDTLAKTTQRAVRDFEHYSGTRRLKHIAYQLKYRHLRDTVYTDTMFGPCRAWGTKNNCAQTYSTGFGFVWAMPMQSRADAHYTLDVFHRRFGVPAVITSDDAPELITGDFRRKCLRVGTHLAPAEAYTPNQNHAESAIRELKLAYRRAMRRANSPELFWDHCYALMAEIRSHTALPMFQLQGDVPMAVLTGDTPDISHLVEFIWWERVWFLDPKESSLDRRCLGRYLGPSHDVGGAMCAKILTEKGKVVSRTSVFPFSIEDHNSETVKKRCDEFDESLRHVLRNRIDESPPEELQVDDDRAYVEYEDDENPATPISDADEVDHEAFDKYISSRVWLPKGDDMAYGTVRRRKRDQDGNLIGRSHSNPMVDTSLYEVEFDDGDVEAIAANEIAEHIYAQVDNDGWTTHLVVEIIDHEKLADAVQPDDEFVVVRGRKKQRRTTKGWRLCCQLADGSTMWAPLKDLKESHPIQVAEYAVANKLVHEPAFKWWVPYTLRKRERIIKQVKTRYLRREQKFGVELPKTVKRALEIDEETGTTLWRDAIRKEMKGVEPAFDILDEGARPPPGYQRIPVHIVFDVKMDFTRKARLVAGGHVTGPPSSVTYASVVSRESVRIAFLIAALNDMELLAGDIANAYLNAPCREKVYTVCGPEFGSMQGRIARIVRALYGLKSSGAAWRAHLASTLSDIGFQPSRGDRDVWLRPAVKEDGTRYYEYVLVYTDDLLVISKKPKEVMDKLGTYYVIKPDSIKKPDKFLGSDIGTYRHPDDPTKEYWTMGSEQYVKDAVRNVKAWLEARGSSLKTRAPSVLPSGYRPELDATDYCNEDDAQFFMEQIGVLRWAVELGRIDIAAEVSMLSSYLVAPRRGHVDAVLHMFSYLNAHQRSRIVFDSSYQELPVTEKPDWTDFYPDATELLPPDMPEPLGKSVQMFVFCDADHAGDKVTRRSRAGVLVFLNRAPIVWFTKKMNSIETSTFGSEFMALKIATEIVQGLRYKLRMMGVPLDGPAHVCVDNQSVVYNTTLPESTLKKKSNAVAYHFVRENVAADTIDIRFEPSESNLADCLTKIQPGPVRQRLIQKILF